MEDLIKREDAIEAIKSNSYAPGDDYMEINGYGAIEDIRALPSADRPTWIPCSERLPEKAGHYLCSFKKPNFIDNIYVDLAYWTGGRWYGYSANAINAWMPLPEPWKGADDERKDIQSTDE